VSDSGNAYVLAFALIGLFVLHSKQLGKMQREIDLIVAGDLETLKLKRKLDGYPDADGA